MTNLRFAPALVALTVLSGSLAAPAQADISLNFTKIFRTVLPKIQDRTGIPIRVPRTIKLFSDSSTKVYGTGFGDSNSYDFDLAFAPNCGHSTACFGAHLAGERGRRLSGGTPVTLTKNIKGRYFKTACGASCSKPQVEWIQNGVLYTVQLAVGEPERARLVALANAAIRAPRL